MQGLFLITYTSLCIIGSALGRLVSDLILNSFLLLFFQRPGK